MKRLSLLLFAGTVMASDNGAPPWERLSPPPGQSLFRENCAVCHDIDKDQKSTRKIGPSLNHLFKNPKLPLSRGKPNRAYVVVRIQYGGPVMPAFMKRMTDPQIAELLTYLESK